MKQKSVTFRLILLAMFLSLVMILYTIRLIDMQFVNADYYLTEGTSSGNPTVVIPAARGEIFDRNGEPLATNRECFNIVFERANMNYSDINANIEKLIVLLGQTGESYKDDLPLKKKEPYDFTEDEGKVAALISDLNLAHYATAQNCYDNMVGAYDLQDYSGDLQRLIMGVRYTMDTNDFSIINPYTFAQGISIDTVQMIKETAGDLPGVTVETVAIRDYPDTELAPYIIGTIGPIYEEEWEDLKEQGYRLNAEVGKSGIEKEMEEYLRGKDGKKEIIQTTDEDGNFVTTENIIEQPENGNTVYLTIDAGLQKAIQQELAAFVQEKKALNDQVGGGAVVVQDVNTGEILASVSYPSYDMDTYKKDYDSLLDDPSKPLFDRALNGIYPPGSTFKPCTALIGLQTGAITPQDIIYCNNAYTYFSDHTFHCLGWHGGISVRRALTVSCNIFFYETGRRLGIDNLNQYTRLLGLGVKTGVEITESKGILAGKEYRSSLDISEELKVWNPGDTVQAAIGQSDNAFTPVQLSTYVSTIANGGTRYQAHFVREIRTYSQQDTVVEPYANVLNNSGIDEGYFDVVKEGMLSVTNEGTASALANYPVKIGGKTGTAETGVKGEEDNAVFIAFAPYDKPEIGISVVIEHGGHGSTVTPLIEKICNAYFFGPEDTDSEDTSG